MEVQGKGRPHFCYGNSPDNNVKNTGFKNWPDFSRKLKMDQSQILRKRTYKLISSYFYAFYIYTLSRLETSFYCDFASVHTFSLAKNLVKGERIYWRRMVHCRKFGFGMYYPGK